MAETVLRKMRPHHLGDGKETGGTVGVSDNIIEASRALVNSIEYKLRRDERQSRRP